MITPEFWNLNFGNVLTIAVLGAGGIAFVYTLRGKVEAMSDRVLGVEEQIKKLLEVLITQARQDERLAAVDRRSIDQSSRADAQGRRLDEIERRFNRTEEKER